MSMTESKATRWGGAQVALAEHFQSGGVSDRVNGGAGCGGKRVALALLAWAGWPADQA